MSKNALAVTVFGRSRARPRKGLSPLTKTSTPAETAAFRIGVDGRVRDAEWANCAAVGEIECTRRGWTESRQLAILIAMSVAEQMSLAEVKDRLSQVVEDVETEHARVTITKHGRPAAVLISADDLQSLEETLAVLSDAAVMDQIRASREELSGGTTAQTLSKEQMMGRIRP